MSTKLSYYVGSRDNNFNLLRFIAASLVIFSHSYPIALGKGNHDIFYELSGELTFGMLAVDIFLLQVDSLLQPVYIIEKI